MEQFNVTKVGAIRHGEAGSRIVLAPHYTPALTGLAGFSHLQVLWWFSGCDDGETRSTLQESAPYKKGPPTLGVFATRSPRRPNPIALSCVEVLYLDEENSVIGIPWIDADEGTPVLDIKPYTPSLDRVARPGTPAWCAHWPGDVESSGNFAWEAEFNF